MLGLIEWFSVHANSKESPTEAKQEAGYIEMEPLLLDQMATVSEAIHPHHSGRVFFEGTYWFARCPFNMTLPSNTPVVVRDRYNLTLLVEPLLSSTQN